MSFLATLKARLHAAIHPDLNFEAKWIVTLSDSEVSCTRPNGKVETLKWDDLEIVAAQAMASTSNQRFILWVRSDAK